MSQFIRVVSFAFLALLFCNTTLLHPVNATLSISCTWDDGNHEDDGIDVGAEMTFFKAGVGEVTKDTFDTDTNRHYGITDSNGTPAERGGDYTIDDGWTVQEIIAWRATGIFKYPDQVGEAYAQTAQTWWAWWPE
jgi:hypothetical protein